MGGTRTHALHVAWPFQYPSGKLLLCGGTASKSDLVWAGYHCMTTPAANTCANHWLRAGQRQQSRMGAPGTHSPPATAAQHTCALSCSCPPHQAACSTMRLPPVLHTCALSCSCPPHQPAYSTIRPSHLGACQERIASSQAARSSTSSHGAVSPGSCAGAPAPARGCAGPLSCRAWGARQECECTR